MEAGLDPDGFEKKFISRFKGFGVFSKKLFEKGDFLLEYVGELLQGQNILQRHLQHEVSTRRLVRRGRIPRHYMFHFKYNGKKMCLDATQYKDRLGQFVNDTKEGLASCNARMKLSSYKCRPRLLLYAARDIQIGEEISFDYGDENNLWWRREGLVGSNHAESPDICPEVSDVHPSTAPGVVRSDHEETPDFCPEVSDVHPSTAPGVVSSQHVESPDISPEVSDVHPSTAPDVVRSQHEDSLDTGIEVYVVLQSTAPGSVSSHHESPYEGQEVSVELPSTGLAFVQPNLDISVPASCDEDSDSNSITYPYLDKVVNEADSTSNAQSEVSQVQTVSAVRQGKNDYSKQHACLFCGKLDFKITRHMCTWHKNEREIALLPSVSKNKHSDEFHKRERALDRLRNQGDFMYNIRQLQSGGGPLIIARRQEAGRHLAADYLPCQYCLKFYVKSELWRHGRKCKSVPISTNDQESSHIKASRALLFGAGVYDKGKCSEFYQHVVESMNHDETGETVRKDLSIIRVGQVLYGRLGRQRAAEVRYRLRLLGRLKCELVQDILKRNQNQLSTFIKPEHFNNIVEAVKQMVRISSEKSLNGVIMFDKPETAKKIGQLVKRLAEHKQGLAIKERSNSDRQDAIDFLTLYETEWKDTIGSIASQTTKERRFNKKDMLPLTEDLVKLRRYCDKMVNEYSVLLRQDTNIQNWRKLANITLCKVQLFNFRRGNECSKMLKEKYETRADWRQCNEEIFKSLDKVECELAKRMDLVEIMGKKDRKVPVLLTPSIRDALDLLNQTRGDVEIPVSNPYVFAKGLENYIKGSEALNTVLNMVPDLQFPEYIRFPKMRKYLATVVQIYGLSEIELQEVARHLGHELSVHRQYYRLQDDVIELAKISKLLLAVEAGKAHQFAGKSFEDIDIDCLLDIDETDEKTDGIDENVAETESVESMVVDLNQEYPGAVRNLKTAREPLQVQDLQKARTYQFEDEDLDDSVKDPSYTEEMSDSESGDDGCSKQRKTASKKKWSNLERMALQPLVVAAVRERKPPRKHQIQKLQQNSFLKDINWLKLKHQVWAIAQTQLKKASKTQSVV